MDAQDVQHDLAPPNRGAFNSTHIHGTHVPVAEPSTASGTEVAGLIGNDKVLVRQPLCLGQIGLAQTLHRAIDIGLSCELMQVEPLADRKAGVPA
jgi:hypothetical protein